MMKNTSITFDQYRRNIRRELFIQRQSDRDHSETRLTYDAKQLDAKLKAQGYKLNYLTEWGQTRVVKAIADRATRPPQLHTVNLNSMGV
jgi:hypothetical protein